MNIVFYGARNMGAVVLSYLVARAHTVTVIAEDQIVADVASYYNLTTRRLAAVHLLQFDLFLCCHGRRIIPEADLRPGQFVNIHPCLFKYKGHDPITRYIANGDTEASVESLYMTEVVDGGSVIEQEFFRTPVIHSHGEFYNLALPHYLACVHRTMAKLEGE